MKKLFSLNDKNTFYLVMILFAAMFAIGIDRSLRVTDYQDFYDASRNYLAGEDPYHIEEAKKFFQGVDFLDMLKAEAAEKLGQMKGRFGSYIYPPTFAFLMQPMGLLNYEISSVIFFLLNFSAFLGIIYFLKAKSDVPIEWKTILFVLLINLLFIESHLNNNQIGFLLLFMVLAAIRLKPVLAGFVLSLAIAIKLTPAVFLLYFLVFKRYKEIFYTGLFLIFWILLPFASGFDYNLMILDNWYNLVLDKFIKSPVFRAYKGNQSLISTLSKYFVPFSDPFNQSEYGMPFVQASYMVIKFLHLSLSIGILLPLFIKIKNGIGKNQIISALFIVSILLSGISWVHSFVFMIFPVFYLLQRHATMSKNDRYLFYFLAVSPIVLTQIDGDAYKMFSGFFYTGLGYYYLVLKNNEKPV